MAEITTGAEKTTLVEKQHHADDEEIEPQVRYSSSDVIAAAEELKFEAKKKRNKRLRIKLKLVK